MSGKGKYQFTLPDKDYRALSDTLPWAAPAGSLSEEEHQIEQNTDKPAVPDWSWHLAACRSQPSYTCHQGADFEKDESWIIQWAGLDAATEIAEANIVHKCVKKIGRMSAYYTSSPDNFCCAVSGPLQPVEVPQCLSKLLADESAKTLKEIKAERVRKSTSIIQDEMDKGGDEDDDTHDSVDGDKEDQQEADDNDYNDDEDSPSSISCDDEAAENRYVPTEIGEEDQVLDQDMEVRSLEDESEVAKERAKQSKNDYGQESEHSEQSQRKPEYTDITRLISEGSPFKYTSINDAMELLDIPSLEYTVGVDAFQPLFALIKQHKNDNTAGKALAFSVVSKTENIAELEKPEKAKYLTAIRTGVVPSDIEGEVNNDIWSLITSLRRLVKADPARFTEAPDNCYPGSFFIGGMSSRDWHQLSLHTRPIPVLNKDFNRTLSNFLLTGKLSAILTCEGWYQAGITFLQQKTGDYNKHVPPTSYALVSFKTVLKSYVLGGLCEDDLDNDAAYNITGILVLVRDGSILGGRSALHGHHGRLYKTRAAIKLIMNKSNRRTQQIQREAQQGRAQGYVDIPVCCQDGTGASPRHKEQ
ncbi:uncharacterized protein E0L32_000645 [Thyridium curvatum]|uniref:Uncharacterized protein n=1 Tax=Thyridium curvatum TaxID=1093900 RepID=A0A507BB49_9PEZI|nr:uncharacterized protein E0L32_000645 [Thyridium curvatum]TPX14251.1 hypothetical protein E0L32_000645 [Thyridium curvatum]